MARYILIDNYSGWILGDSADIKGEPVTGTPAEIAEAVDKSIGDHDGKTYEFRSTAPDDASDGYHMWRVTDADAEAVSAEAILDVVDRQDPDTIEAVKRACHYDGFVYARPPRDY